MTMASISDDGMKKISKANQCERPYARPDDLQQSKMAHCHRPRWSNAADAEQLELDDAIPPLQIVQGGNIHEGPQTQNDPCR